MNIIKKIKEILKNKYFKFGFWSLIYLLFVIWIGSFWLLLGLPIIFDFYISNKVNWTFWKKRGLEKKSKLIEWIDALVFAIIAASIIRMFFIEAYMIPTSSMEKNLLVGDYLFVSKVSYGPRMPNTPLAIPFTHHTLPLTHHTAPYLDWIQMPYKRLAGFSHVKERDVVVFNFPTGDTVVAEMQNPDYYAQVRYRALSLKNGDIQSGQEPKDWNRYMNRARKDVRQNGTIITRPVDKQENYIKRCVAIHGQTLEIIDGLVHINGKQTDNFKQLQYKYKIETNGHSLNPERLFEMGVSKEDLKALGTGVLPLTYENYKKIKRFKVVKSIVRDVTTKGDFDPSIFPYDERYKWNLDYYGPLYIPEAGKTIDIDTSNISIYKRIIHAYEHNDLKIKDGKIFINGKETNKYTFKMNYYFMMGDNRHGSADSRYWGFVPEDHIVGKALFIWFSTDKDRGWFDGGIRFNRIFKGIE